MPDDQPLIEVRDLRVQFPTEDGWVTGVDGISFDLAGGEILGIVGESGSGKSVASRALLGLHNGTGARVSGEIIFGGRDLVSASESELRRLRGAEIAMIFQDPMSSLHPYFTIGDQISEAYRIHRGASRRAGQARAIELLDLVGIPDPRRRYDAYPHEFSGGMRQRVVIAMALACDPKVLIADEPTTALDVTVQAQILELIKDLRTTFGSAVILITHDLGVVAETCDRVIVMYAGRCVETAPVAELFAQPQMPYTWGLLRSMPRLDRSRRSLDPIPGSPPSLAVPAPGCAFAPRCDYSARVPDGRCGTERPELIKVADDHLISCHLPAEIRAGAWSGEEH